MKIDEHFTSIPNIMFTRVTRQRYVHTKRYTKPLYLIGLDAVYIQSVVTQTFLCRTFGANTATAKQITKKTFPVDCVQYELYRLWVALTGICKLILNSQLGISTNYSISDKTNFDNPFHAHVLFSRMKVLKILTINTLF